MPDLPDTLALYFDGACEPVNPGGTASYGWLVQEVDPTAPEGMADSSWHTLYSGSGVVGTGAGMTNNVAEYHALGHGLRWLADQGWKGKILVRGDSKLVIEQMAGRWACNAPGLVPLRGRCRELMDKVTGWGREAWSGWLAWVPREQNEHADKLSQNAWVKATGKPFPVRQRRAGRRDRA